MTFSSALGCSDSNGDDPDGTQRGGPDGGSSPDASANAGEDGSDAADTDAGKLVWMPMDAGADDRSSSNGSGADSSPLAGRDCAQVRKPLPSALLPRCSSATRDCVAGCPDTEEPDACRDRCLASDQTPPDPNFGLGCDSCVYLNLFGCIDAAGCHEGVAEFFCCLEDRCSGPAAPDNCAEALCGNELRTAATCGFYAQESCLDFLQADVATCFPEPDADGGV